MKKSKLALFQSVIALVLCVSMLIGTTYALFTDAVTSSNNIITSGNLDVELHWADQYRLEIAEGETVATDVSEWKDASEGAIFDYEYWEPGYTDTKYVKISNQGNLALVYRLYIVPDTPAAEGEADLADVIDVYVLPAEDAMELTREQIAGLTPVGTLSELMTKPDGAFRGVLLPVADKGAENVTLNAEDEQIAVVGESAYCIILKMQETAGNEYQDMYAGNGFSVQLVATQYTWENDSFGNDYDTDAKFPIPDNDISVNTSVDVTVEDNMVKDNVTIQGSNASAEIPSGVQVSEGTDKLTLSISEKEASDSNITLGENEAMRALDVHVEGVAEGNTQPMEIYIKGAAPKGLNAGNLKLYHVENGVSNAMTAVDIFTAHNQFKYDPATGDVTLYMATFSEVAVVVDTENAWNGEYDYSWYMTCSADYIIANADQLAAFGKIVGGMAEGFERDNFDDKTIKLIADINLGDANNANEDLIFHPIGYYYKDGDSTVKSFEGTFNGNGHSISDFYQNTWEINGDYDGTYYKDAMGLFGYVYNGTVKNLTVANFSSDGEFTPTGVIAAYADGNSTFENIAIVGCNPRVYNTGNGGIIGIAGDTSAANDDHITLKNITVDNSNKISALWGSWDVACGGLVGMYRGNVDDSGNATGDTISFTNCHVAAQIDVYNDVCANYQYYAYRYAGMIIGSVRHNTTKDGKTIPNMTGISASNCTVNYGDWNDYYYCEFEKNTMASYSEDYQFSRVPHSDLNFTDSNGNGFVDADERASVTGCKHTHTAEENHQAIYLPFHQLFTGYSWGVNSIGLKEYSGIVTDLGITEGDQQESVKKFEYKDNIKALQTGKEYTLGTLFSAVDNGVEIVDASVTVGVTDLDDADGVVTAVFNGEPGDWKGKTITFEGTGEVELIIQDYQFCIPTTFKVKIADTEEIISTEKFDKLFTNTNFVYRVGNKNPVPLNALFVAKSDVEIGTVTVKSTEGKVATSNGWESGTIDLTGYTGRITVEISDDDPYCTPTVLELEVVDAVNATGATNATDKNVVLLNDCGFSSLEVSGGYTLYGNGFTMTCSSDSAALDMGYSFVTLNNGTLDNVQIVCPNFDYAVLYKSNMTESGNRSETTDRTRYYNVKSGVIASGNSQILNSRISGGRAAVNVSGGNCVIDNSRIELGAVASILVGSANSLTLRDVTLIQKPTASTYDSSKILMGFSVLLICDSAGNAAPVTLEGKLVQNAWVDESDKEYVPSAGQAIVSTVLGKTEYLHDIDGDGTKESLNLGFAYMPESLTSKVNATTITDNRTNKNDVPYDYAEVAILNGKTYVYSYKNTNNTDNSFKDEDQYVPNTNGDIVTVVYSDTADGLTTGKSFGTDGWVYELNVDLDKLSGYALDFSKLSMTINGVPVTDFKVNGNAKPTTPIAVTSGGTTYTLTATIEGKDYSATYKVTGTETSKESPSKISGPTTAGFGVAKSYGGDWSGAADVLTGVKIKYWSVAENKYIEHDFSNFTVPGNAGKLNGTNNYWEYTHTNNDFTLKVTNTVAIHSGKSVYGMPIRGTDGKLYFTISSTNGYVGSGTTSRSITMQYEFADNNGGEKLTFTHTFNINYSKDEQYSYSDLSGSGKLTKLETSSGGGGGGCVTPDTLITLADGTQVRVDSLTGNEELLVWNMETGKYDTAPIVFVDSEEEAAYEIIHLYFSDGSDVKVIYEHGFFELDLGEYVYIDATNYADYIGHSFVTEGSINANDWNVVTLDEVVIETEVTTAWSPVTFEHLCYYTNGVLSMPGGIEGLFNIFEVDTNTMRYDAEQMQQDIETYGLFTIEDFGGMITEDAFAAFNGAYLKVAMGKGLLTWEDIAYMAERYIPLM